MTTEDSEFNPTDPQVRLKLRYYINQLNFVAELVDRGLVSAELSKQIFYDASEICLEKCSKFIEGVKAENPAFAVMLRNKVADWRPERRLRRG